MVIEMFGRNEQPLEEITCLAVLGGQKSVYRFRPKRLVEKAPVQSPSIAVRQKDGIEALSRQFAGDEVWTIRIVLGPVLE
jgi:hypothetical protein